MVTLARGRLVSRARARECGIIAGTFCRDAGPPCRGRPSRQRRRASVLVSLAHMPIHSRLPARYALLPACANLLFPIRCAIFFVEPAEARRPNGASIGRQTKGMTWQQHEINAYASGWSSPTPEREEEVREQGARVGECVLMRFWIALFSAGYLLPPALCALILSAGGAASIGVEKLIRTNLLVSEI